MKRGAGILMPIFSIPCKERFGVLGECAYKFVDFLVESGQTYWQVLPINETDIYGSPFCSTCVYCGNPLFIDLTRILPKKDLDMLCNDSLSLKEYKELKMKLLYKAYKLNYDEYEVLKFIEDNEWVVEYGEFVTILEEYKLLADFPEALKNKNSRECRAYLRRNKDRVNFYVYCQYLFFKQWYELKRYANEKGIYIIGDSPCNSAMDSKEAWADSDMYLLDENLSPTFVAGVPPDYFSSEGQVWNTLIYDYAKMKETGYKYLLDKYKYLLNVYDYLKIDHFRGIEYFYKIPYGKLDGKVGEWVEGPGYEFIDLLKNNGINNLILEDLGIISDGVIRLKDYSKYPGMKVFQFAFGEMNSPFLPENYIENCIAYTGTHDNDTFYSFLENEKNKEIVCKYLNIDGKSDIDKIIKESIFKLYHSKANVVIINPQDILNQNSNYRFNTPGTININWSYCAGKELYNKENIDFLLAISNSSNRRG